MLEKLAIIWIWRFETGDGTKVEITGSPKPAKDADGKDTIVLVHTGQISYTSPDGTPINLQFTADENGFQPQGAHLPVAPVA